MELNQGLPFMKNVVGKTYSTSFLKLENIFNIFDFFVRIIMSCMYVLFLYIKKKVNMYLYKCLAGNVHGVS